MKKSRILVGIWMLFLVLAYLVSASITIGIAAVATVLLGFFCFFLSNSLGNIFVYLFLGFKTFFGFGHLCVFYFFFYNNNAFLML